MYKHARGYEIETGPGLIRESDTATCQHCNRVFYVKPLCDPADAGGLCKSCMGLICPACVDLGGCDPTEKKIERIEKARRQGADSDRFTREVAAAFSRMR